MPANSRWDLIRRQRVNKLFYKVLFDGYLLIPYSMEFIKQFLFKILREGFVSLKDKESIHRILTF